VTVGKLFFVIALREANSPKRKHIASSTCPAGIVVIFAPKTLVSRACMLGVAGTRDLSDFTCHFSLDGHNRTPEENRSLCYQFQEYQLKEFYPAHTSR
jgi:hypothetical protein